MPSFELPPPGSKTAYRRIPDPQKPLGIAKTTAAKSYNTENQREKFYGVDVESRLDAYNEGLSINYPQISTEGAFKGLQQQYDLLRNVELEQFGVQRPRASGVYDYRVAPGRQYRNLSPMPIDFQGNRRGGIYETGQAVNTRFASFTEDEDLVEDPTTSTNVSRPRTIAAAYAPDEEKLTIVFRDSTFYNYYEVTMQEWEFFKKNYSKGPYIKKVLDKKPRGVASTDHVPDELLKHATTSTRLNQIGKLTKPHAHDGTYRAPKVYDKPPSRRFSKSTGYKAPTKAPRGVPFKKSASAPNGPAAPTSKSANAAAARRQRTRRALGGS